jgi:hypothetical protein
VVRSCRRVPQAGEEDAGKRMLQDMNVGGHCVMLARGTGLKSQNLGTVAVSQLL